MSPFLVLWDYFLDLFVLSRRRKFQNHQQERAAWIMDLPGEFDAYVTDPQLGTSFEALLENMMRYGEIWWNTMKYDEICNFHQLPSTS